MLAASAITEKYRCPGEAYSITESVHLARLAAFYSKCRHCPHAPGAEPPVNGAGSAAPSIGYQSALFTPEGVRGRYLNDLTRSTASEIAGAMVSCLFVVPPSGGIPVVDNDGPPEGGTTSAIILAHDERPSSPDIVTGVGQALRRMGCQVVDIGLATRPAFLFAIDHLHGGGGVHVTGAGCDPGWTGLDFVTRRGIPCSAPGELDAIRARYHGGYARPSRRPGSQKTFDAKTPYQARFWKHFHALRPLKIAFACSSPGVQNVFQQVFRKLACRLIPAETPTRSRAPGDMSDPDVARTSQTVRAAGADLGLLVEDDGEQCTIIDERGTIVSPRKIARLLAEIATVDQPASARIVVPTAWNDGPGVSREVWIAEPNREHVTAAMFQEQATFGADGQGRYWFSESYPACDALLTLVHLLQALSRSDAPFSEVVA